MLRTFLAKAQKVTQNAQRTPAVTAPAAEP
jgi:hypothetical protein